MKRTLSFLIAAITAIIFLTSCEPDIETSSWLKGTTWKADLAGKSYQENSMMGLFPGEVAITEGYIKIHFSFNGYDLRIDSDFSKVILKTKLFPDYDYPALYFPIEWDEVDNKPVNVIYNVGTISDDLKTIHFDTFRDRGHDWGDYSTYIIYEDIDFIRQ